MKYQKAYSDFLERANKPKLKVCKKCRVEKSLAEYYIDKGKPRPSCKECCKSYKKDHYKNPEVREREKQYQLEYRTIKNNDPEYIQKKLEEKEDRRIVREKLREESKAKQKIKKAEYYKSEHYKSFRKVYMQKYVQSDKGKVKFANYSHKRRALKLNQLHPNHNPDIEKTLNEMKLRISKCLGIKHHLDHIYPLNQGGPHHHENLQVIPQTLNNRKQDNLNYQHPSLIHWTQLPQHLLDWIEAKKSSISENNEQTLK